MLLDVIQVLVERVPDKHSAVHGSNYYLATTVISLLSFQVVRHWEEVIAERGFAGFQMPSILAGLHSMYCACSRVLVDPN